MTDGAHRLMLRAPFDGVAMPLGDVSDPVFSQGMMGDGVAIEYTNPLCFDASGTRIGYAS